MVPKSRCGPGCPHPFEGRDLVGVSGMSLGLGAATDSSVSLGALDLGNWDSSWGSLPAGLLP